MRFAVLMLMLVLWSGATVAAQVGKVDRTFTAKGDITADGRAEILTLHIVGKSMQSSFRWSLVITDDTGVVLYRVDRDDASQDGFFGTDGYEARCADYESCKKRYYFQDLPETIFAALKPSPAAWKFDQYTFPNLRDTAHAYLVHHGVAQVRINGALVEMRKTLNKPGFHMLDVPLSAAQYGEPMIWVASVHMFVPFYQD
ncbi:hypothetical protein [Rhodanobacter sp. L36]|uniref:hypothetical protein n=1 Tax=Rhodanobacter sp. L36 TaxID=1747221 RepID=UPI00131BCDDD|nr:hypothetical protein [Rhodanobacter sp. L36]